MCVVPIIMRYRFFMRRHLGKEESKANPDDKENGNHDDYSGDNGNNGNDDEVFTAALRTSSVASLWLRLTAVAVLARWSHTASAARRSYTRTPVQLREPPSPTRKSRG